MMKSEQRPAADTNLSVVAPVYRNADTLVSLYDRLCPVLENLGVSFEIIFVNDASPDHSLAVLKPLQMKDVRVAVLNLIHNVGQHQAVLQGLAKSKGEWIVVMDADLQDPPEAIPALLTKAQEGYSAVFAGRRGKYESPSRLLTSRLFKGILHLLTGVPADAGMFLAMNRNMADRILKMEDRHPFVVAMIACARLPVTSIPVTRVQRPLGNSAYNFRSRLRRARRALIWLLRWRLRNFRASGHPFRPPRIGLSPPSG